MFHIKLHDKIISLKFISIWSQKPDLVFRNMIVTLTVVGQAPYFDSGILRYEFRKYYFFSSYRKDSKDITRILNQDMYRPSLTIYLKERFLCQHSFEWGI